MEETMLIEGKEYRLIRLLGHGKGGYSWLAENDGKKYTVKQIHHEPCDYYQFGNKIEAEYHDYGSLLKAGIRIPEMLGIDFEKERIVKEYIDGETILELLKKGHSVDEYLFQVKEMADKARMAGLNIDYFPSNFVVCNGLLYYVDYECNMYMDEWSFENWGIRYWSLSEELRDYLASNEDTGTFSVTGE